MNRHRLLMLTLFVGVVLGVFLTVSVPQLQAPQAHGQSNLVMQDELNTIDVFQRNQSAVVHIATVTRHPTVGGMPPGAVPDIIEGEGAGFFIDRGVIVTNNHVIEGSRSITVFLSDGTEVPAKVIGGDATIDVAVLQVSIGENHGVVTLGSSSNLRVGQKVIAIGNPFGLDSSLTVGVISGIGRLVESSAVSEGAPTIPNAIQIDAALNPGNSGGPLFNSAGEVIGINTSIVSPTGTFSGIGLALPIDDARQAVQRIMARGPQPVPSSTP